MNIKNLKCLLIDFEDSFTFNIVAKLHTQGIKVQVCNINKMGECLDQFLAFPGAKLLIYGPGPGHPLDYKSQLPNVVQLIENKQLLQFGICLGHQIIWSQLGLELKRLQEPYHGRSRQITIPKWPEVFNPNTWEHSVDVQFYNSWYVAKDSLKIEHEMFSNSNTSPQIYSLENQIIMGTFKNILSYQFHPESIGTSCPDFFFSCIKQLMYNYIHDPGF